MALLWKFLYNSRYIKYVAYGALFLSLLILGNLWSFRFNMDDNYRYVLPRFNMFSYRTTDLTPKYILIWDKYYLMYKNNRLSRGMKFPNLKCKVSNCIFSDDKYLLDGDHTRFDAIIFSEKALDTHAIQPEKRAKSQIYIFSTIESAYNYPACELQNDDFFNWTMTYRLDSDVPWNYFVVRNATRHAVAPSMRVKWQKSSQPISPSIKNILLNKKKAAAWLVSHCKADSLRDDYITRLQEHLFHFSLKIDVYGDCTQAKCTDNDCEEMFTRDYFFYMAFENSFSEDYVTEKVLHGYNNYVVPIVFGGGNYSRFLPPGSYLNAHDLHPYNLAFIMHEAMNNPEKYEEYFRWTNTYTVDSVDDLLDHHPLCDLCEALNSEKAKRTRMYRKFRVWWNGLNGMKWCLPKDFWNETSLLNVDGRHFFDMSFKL